MFGIVLLCAAVLSGLLCLSRLACSMPRIAERPTYSRLSLLAILLIAFGVFIFVGPGTVTACPPQLQLSTGCQVQAQQLRQQVIVQPQAVYAAPLIQQQVIAQPYYQQQLVQQVVAAQHITQPVIVQQVRQHRQAIVVQQVRQPRVQVQRSVIRTR